MTYAIQVRHLSKRYGSHLVVDDMSFDVPSGGVVGLIGPNGAGKTTTMKALLGLVRPSGGDITLLDTSVGSSGWGTVLGRVGSMIEEPPIYANMTARQNLQYQSLATAGRVDSAQIDELLLLVDLAARADERPKKYSLGMKQRLGIAISLIGKPELVLLDEPANGLDPAGIIEIRKLLRRLPEAGTTVLVSSHQLAEVQQACDELVIIANGRLITQGTTNEILSSQTAHRFNITVPEADGAAATVAIRNAGLNVNWITDEELVVEPPSDIDGAILNKMLVDAGIYASAIGKPTASLEEAFLDLVETQAPDSPAIPKASGPKPTTTPKPAAGSNSTGATS